jgi:hypothetical protein
MEATMKRIGLPLMAVVALGLTQASTRAFNPQPEPPAFGMVGIGRGQFAVLNAVLTTPVPDDSVPPPDPDSPPPDDGVNPPDDGRPVCRLVLSFVGADGRTLMDASGAEAKKTVELQGGVAASLTLRAADVLADAQLRRAIRAVMQGPPDDNTPSDCNGLVATMEIVGPNGWTQLLYAPIPDDSIGPPDDGALPPDDQQPPPDDNVVR